MNLFNNPSLTELSALVARNADYFKSYNVIVDFDGEVLIEPSSSKTVLLLNKYKFYFRGLKGKGNIGIIAARNLRYLNQLYKNLLYCWENDLKGVIDHHTITGIQTINHWLERNNISTIKEGTGGNTVFFKHTEQGHHLSR
jgi:inorganic pyrophosphatase/exopolyphosphatase